MNVDKKTHECYTVQGNMLQELPRELFNDNGTVKVDSIGRTAEFFHVSAYRLREDIRRGKLRCIICGKRKVLLNFVVVYMYLQGEYLTENIKAVDDQARTSYQPIQPKGAKTIPPIF